MKYTSVNPRDMIHAKDTREFLKMLESIGYTFARQKNSSHAVYTRQNSNPVTIPMHGKDIATGTKRQIVQCIYGRDYNS